MFKWLGAFTRLACKIIFESETLPKVSKLLEAGLKPPPVEGRDTLCLPAGDQPLACNVMQRAF